MVTETKQFCHQCGAEIVSGDSFCQECGTKALTINNEAPPNIIPQSTTKPMPTKQKVNLSLKPLVYFLIIAGMALSAFIIYPLLINSSQSTNWSGFRGNAANTGATTTGPQPPLKLLWSKKIASFLPSITNGVIYNLEVDKNEKSALVARDAKTGKEIWRYDKPETISPVTSVAGGMVYVAAGNKDNSDSARYLLALDTKTGKEIWRYDKPEAISPVTVTSVAGGMVYVAAGNKDNGGGYLGYLLALDTKTGKEKWRSSEYGFNDFSVPTVAGGMVYVAAENKDNSAGYLLALDTKTGKEKWRSSEYGFNNFSVPAVAGGMVYVMVGNKDNSGGYLGYLLALDTKTGKEKWRSSEDRLYFDSFPIVSNNTVYIIGINKSISYYLLAFNAKTGSETWRSHKLQVSKKANTLFLEAANDIVAVSSFDGSGLHVYGRSN